MGSADVLIIVSDDKETNLTTVGIVTLNGNHNYGNRLQLYASKAIFDSLGVEGTVLIPSPHLYAHSNPVWNAKCFIKQILGRNDEAPYEEGMTSGRLTAFERFSAYIPSQAVEECDLPGLSDRYDYFSVGSDQVWNPDYNRYEESWYFLKFARREQRVALSPSIGLSELSHRQAHKMRDGLRGFNRLSVRERKGAELIKDCSGFDALVTSDPTLVLSAGEWRAVSDERCTPAGPYVFTYLLGGVGGEAFDVLDKTTNHGRIPVVSLSDRQKPGEPDAGPAEFIDLIDHATHVVTDSFHAAVFSSILHTPLTIVHREGGASMFSRLEQLSEMLGIKEKVYGSSAYDLTKAACYEGVDDAIAREREKFMSYLKGCLDVVMSSASETFHG
ncbi:MAG: polysaccharide pyruvyl transferase family protein [Collinsella aerofaciens]